MEWKSTTGRPTTKKIHILQEQIVHRRQEYRIFYNPENRVGESSCYEQPLSRWNCTWTWCAVHLFGGVELRNYGRQLLIDIVAQRRCTAAFTQTLPSTTPSRTAWLTRALTRLSFVILCIVYGRRLGWAHQGWRRLGETWQNQPRRENDGERTNQRRKYPFDY